MDDKISAKVPIDPELAELLKTVDIEEFKKYIEREVSYGLKEEIEKMIDEDFEKFLHGDGSIDTTSSSDPLVLLDFASMHPSMWVKYPSNKPENHYQRMMMHRRQKKYGRKR